MIHCFLFVPIPNGKQAERPTSEREEIGNFKGDCALGYAFSGPKIICNGFYELRLKTKSSGERLGRLRSLFQARSLFQRTDQKTHNQRRQSSRHPGRGSQV
jgi:hypothetical protein